MFRFFECKEQRVVENEKRPILGSFLPEKKITIIGEYHDDLDTKEYILSNILDGTYPKNTVIALETVLTRYFCQQVTPSDLGYHLADYSTKLAVQKSLLTRIISEATKRGIFITGIENPDFEHSFSTTGKGLQERLRSVNHYARQVIDHFINNNSVPKVVVLCGLAHLDISFNVQSVPGLRQYFEHSTCYMSKSSKSYMSKKWYKDAIPEGVLELPKLDQKES